MWKFFQLFFSFIHLNLLNLIKKIKNYIKLAINNYTNFHMRWSHGENILIELTQYTFIFKVMTFYGLKLITYNLK